jgi:hypothetical protein
MSKPDNVLLLLKYVVFPIDLIFGNCLFLKNLKLLNPAKSV